MDSVCNNWGEEDRRARLFIAKWCSVPVLKLLLWSQELSWDQAHALEATAATYISTTHSMSAKWSCTRRSWCKAQFQTWSSCIVQTCKEWNILDTCEGWSTRQWWIDELVRVDLQGIKPQQLEENWNWSYVLLLSFQQRIVSLMWRFSTKPAIWNWWWWWWWTGWIQQTIWSVSILRKQGDFVSSFCAKMAVTQFWGRKHESANNQCRWFHTQFKQLVRVQGFSWGKWWVRARLTDTQHQWILRFISGYE